MVFCIAVGLRSDERRGRCFFVRSSSPKRHRKFTFR